jgi:hypothetical protein
MVAIASMRSWFWLVSAGFGCGEILTYRDWGAYYSNRLHRMAAVYKLDTINLCLPWFAVVELRGVFKYWWISTDGENFSPHPGLVYLLLLLCVILFLFIVIILDSNKADFVPILK